MFFFGRETQREYVWGKKKTKKQKKAKTKRFFFSHDTQRESVCE